jgi:hypothetical protein
MLEIKWEWVVLFGLLLLLLGYAAYQKRCWLCDDAEDGEGRDGR